jgi:hypothetical protein
VGRHVNAAFHSTLHHHGNKTIKQRCFKCFKPVTRVYSEGFVCAACVYYVHCFHSTTDKTAQQYMQDGVHNATRHHTHAQNGQCLNSQRQQQQYVQVGACQWCTGVSYSTPALTAHQSGSVVHTALKHACKLLASRADGFCQ